MSQAATTVLPNAVVADKTPVVESQQGIGGEFLLGSQFSAEFHIQHPACLPFVGNGELDLQVCEELADVLETASGQPDVELVVTSAGYNTRLFIGRQAHRLRLIEFGVLKGRQPDEPITQGGRQAFLGDVDLIR